MKLSKEVEALLLNQSLCMMATCWDQRPYLSLMNFTFLEEDSRIILSTRKDSKKYFNVQHNPYVSLMVFSERDGISATLLGRATILTEEEEAYYRALHMTKNNKPQFIIGENIGLILFEFDQIVVSDVMDQVAYYND